MKEYSFTLQEKTNSKMKGNLQIYPGLAWARRLQGPVPKSINEQKSLSLFNEELSRASFLLALYDSLVFKKQLDEIGLFVHTK